MIMVLNVTQLSIITSFHLAALFRENLTYAFNLSTWGQRQADLCEFKESLIYITSSRLPRAGYPGRNCSLSSSLCHTAVHTALHAAALPCICVGYSVELHTCTCVFGSLRLTSGNSLMYWVRVSLLFCCSDSCSLDSLPLVHCDHGAVGHDLSLYIQILEIQPPVLMCVRQVFFCCAISPAPETLSLSLLEVTLYFNCW